MSIPFFLFQMGNSLNAKQPLRFFMTLFVFAGQKATMSDNHRKYSIKVDYTAKRYEIRLN
jgi:hypothetical protein